MLGALVIVIGCVVAARGDAPEANAVAVLDGMGSVWRSFTEWASPVILKADGTTRGLIPRVHFWLASEWTEGKPGKPWSSPGPAENWNTVDFDDIDWAQEHCPVGPDLEEKRWNHGGFTMWSDGSPSQVARIFSRGRFEVPDPAGLDGVDLSVAFHGAAIVYVNGKEVARAHVLEKSPGHGIRGEAYTDDVYVGPDGKAITGKPTPKSKPEQLAAYQKRVRQLKTRIPASLLRKGVNVLAIEILRAPYNEIYRAKPKEYKKKEYCAWPWPWPHCRLLDVKLTSSRPEGVLANVGRPKGVQFWFPHPWATVTGFDYGCGAEPVRTLRLVGFRGGAFSAKLVVSSSGAIPDLNVTASALKGDRSSMPASRVTLRYAQPNGLRFRALLDDTPQPVPVTHFRRHRRDPGTRAAVQPVWVTVDVPRDAKPGTYTGTITAQAGGLKPVVVPLEITVHDWLYPEPGDLASHNNFWQAHEIHALRYKLPLWSDEHFKVMGQCLELSKPLANRMCYVPLTVGGYQCGNRESLVRWIRKPDGSFDHDFTVFDRYLDVYDRALGKPGVLSVEVCISIHSRSRPKDGTNPIKVSRLDPATGKVELMSQPPYGSPEGVAFWKPVLAEVKKRLENRGWWDVALVGTASDSGPTKGETETLKVIWPDTRWLFAGHPNRKSVAGMPVGSLAWVWGNGRLWKPSAKQPKYPRPWSGKSITLAFPRTGCSACELKMDFSLHAFRIGAEKNMQCGQDGMGRVGLDFWRYKDERGRTIQLHTAGGQFSFDGSIPYFVAPGPKGPVLTTHSEMYREGLQVREAITFVLKAVDGGKLPAELAGRIESLVARRAARIDKPYGFRDWRQQEDELFSLCAEAAAAGRVGDDRSRSGIR